ncbi:CLUMA_CG018048, isoform A [Clunio marinus]|uniref:CLUMA_CG018048, isoform A n=1 Tax=Clunio marinus TaxID=568069 RepID=A0A1J1IYJ9_9DIPT|nr:CLUMA_CG018048, isoform A [Clunio marinus]
MYESEANNKIYKSFRMHRKSQSKMDMIRRLISVGIVLQLISNIGLSNGAIRSIRLVIEPIGVRRGQSATLRCLYDLDGAPLLSLQFYRGSGEFYRYSPTQSPTKKVFPLSGINVDTAASNATQVVIKNVSFGLSGNFSCEVTADSQSFSTASATAQMMVVEFPETRPTLWTERERYEPGDVLRANCSSPPSRPQAELTLTINNIVVYSTDVQYFKTIEGRTATRIGMRLQLQSIHFGGGPVMNGGGQLILRCTAQIGNLYQEYSEKELGVPQKDPIPARVTSSIAIASAASLLYTLLTAFVTLTHQHLR